MPSTVPELLHDQVFFGFPGFALCAVIVYKLVRRNASDEERRVVGWVAWGLVAYAGALFVAWPFAWHGHYQFRNYPRITPGMLLFCGYLPILSVFAAGMVLRPNRTYRRGRFSRPAHRD